jgi:transposase
VGQWRAVLAELRRVAQACGYADNRWTLWRIREFVAARYGVSHHAHYLSEKLRRSGWCTLRPERAAREYDEVLIAAWLKEHRPRVKKRPTR